jgi:hypothetical protein
LIFPKAIKQRLKLNIFGPDLNQTALLSVEIIFTTLFFSLTFQIFASSSSTNLLGTIYDSQEVSMRVQQLILASQSISSPDNQSAQTFITSAETIKEVADSSMNAAKALHNLSNVLSGVSKMLLSLSLFSVSGVLARLLFILRHHHLYKEYANVNIFITVIMYLFSLSFLLVIL